MEKMITKLFGKYEVTLELFEEGGEQRSYCDIVNTDTGACASLGLAQDMGYLEKDNGEEEKITNSILDKIEEWALSNGY
jgi:hypothetical protein